MTTPERVFCRRCGHRITFIGQRTWVDEGGETRCPEHMLPTPRPSGRNLYHRPQ